MRATVWILFPAFLAALHAGVIAQSLVIPQSMAGVEGGPGTSIPFRLNREVRLQCIYDVDELPFAGPRMIQKLVFRADYSADPGRDQYPVKQYVVLHLAMSSTDVLATCRGLPGAGSTCNRDRDLFDSAWP